MAGPEVDALLSTPTGLVATGIFTQAGGVDCNYVASWDGTAWAPFGGGLQMSNPAGSGMTGLASYRDRVYVVGDVHFAEDLESDGIASWLQVVPAARKEALSIPESRSDLTTPSAAAPELWCVRSVFSRGAVDARIVTAHSCHADVWVADIQGRRVETIFSGEIAVGETPVRWDASAARSGNSRVSAGMYFLVLRTPEGKRQKRILITE